jgi:sialic acid synthase SpsE
MLFIAEIGSNHKGSPPLAFEMIRQAKAAGADIAKFQFRDPDDPIRGMPMCLGRTLKEWCDRFDIEFMASIFNHKALQLSVGIGMKRAKIAHMVAQKDLELTRAIQNQYDEGFISDYQPRPGWKTLWVTGGYPTYPSELEIPEFGAMWDGYSSHAHGIADALIAIAKGAKIIEKHVTLDKTEESIKDNHFALSFGEFSQLASIGREMSRMV